MRIEEEVDLFLYDRRLAALPIGFALFGERAWAFDGVFALRKRDVAGVELVVEGRLQRRHILRPHHHLLGRANAHGRTLEDLAGPFLCHINRLPFRRKRRHEAQFEALVGGHVTRGQHHSHCLFERDLA